MGVYVNPSNRAFQKDIAQKIYVDKTGLLSIINEHINTPAAFFCNSRPRRFGKSMTVNMLSAYYGRKCDSKDLFQSFQIAEHMDFEKHLNKYDIICIDVQSMKGLAGGAKNLIDYIQKKIIEELYEEYPNVERLVNASLQEVLIQINEETDVEFGIILDEWDCIIRDDSNLIEVQKEYIEFLRGLFKGLQASKYIAFAYLTGILPIKKYNTQSALNNFDEYTMIDASEFAPYIGFTEEEVQELCKKYHQDFLEVRRWYDGYFLEGYHVYNPKAVVSLMTRGKFKSYWSATGTYDTIRDLIGYNFAGLKEAIVQMLAGEKISVKVRRFANDMSSFKNRNDVLTALIHLGYLAYDDNGGKAFIPNEEIRSEFLEVLEEEDGWDELYQLMNDSERILRATLDMDEDVVSKMLEKFHMNHTSILQYNDENSLSNVISIAYLSALKYYYKPIREMPTGKGFADIIFIPKREKSNMPVLVIELKWGKTAQTALEQIRDKIYVDALEGYTENMLLVGINYDKKTKIHECIIEKG